MCQHNAKYLLGGTQVCGHPDCACAWLAEATNRWGGVGRVVVARAVEHGLLEDLVGHVQELSIGMVLPWGRVTLGRVLWRWARNVLGPYRHEVMVDDQLWSLMLEGVVHMRGSCIVGGWGGGTTIGSMVDEGRSDRRLLAKQAAVAIAALFGPEWAIYLARGIDEVDMMLIYKASCRWVETRGLEICEAIDRWA